MAASSAAGPSTAAAAPVISDALGYKLRRELVTGKFAVGGKPIDAETMEAKRAQVDAWEAARGADGAKPKCAKWARQMAGLATKIGESTTATATAITAAKEVIIATLTATIEGRPTDGEDSVATAKAAKDHADKRLQAAKLKVAEAKKAAAATKAAAKADAESAKAKAKAKAKGGSRAKSATIPATVDDMVKYCKDLVEENVEASVTAAAQETLGLLAEYGDDQAQCKVLVDTLIKLAVEARKVPVIVAPRVGAGQWPTGEACGDKTAGGRKCGKKDGCTHRQAYAEAAEAEQKRAKTQEEVKVQDKVWDKFRGDKPDSVRYWAG